MLVFLNVFRFSYMYFNTETKQYERHLDGVIYKYDTRLEATIAAKKL